MKIRQFWLVLTVPAALAQTAIKVVPGTAVDGGSGSFSIAITSTTGYAPASVEWTLGYTTTDLTNLKVTAGTAANSVGKLLSCVNGTGLVRCAVWGMNTKAI